MYENNFPRRRYLHVTLRGRKSNRLGIGARVIATAAGQPRVREVYPANAFRSQLSNRVHFGLGDSAVVDRLEIQWPSGLRQVLTGVEADRHIVVTEGEDTVEEVFPGQTFRP
jgi:hypothetical protein